MMKSTRDFISVWVQTVIGEIINENKIVKLILFKRMNYHTNITLEIIISNIKQVICSILI